MVVSIEDIEDDILIIEFSSKGEDGVKVGFCIEGIWEIDPRDWTLIWMVVSVKNEILLDENNLEWPLNTIPRFLEALLSAPVINWTWQ